MISNRSSMLDSSKDDQYTQLTKEEQFKLRSMFNENQVQNYFTKVQINNNTPLETLQIAGLMYGDQGIRKVTFDIKQGNTTIEEKQQNVDNFLVRQKITEEEKKAIQLKIKRQQIIKQLQYLDAQTSPSSKKANPQIFVNFKPPNVFSKQQHDQIVQSMLKDREERDKKHKKNVELIERSLQKKKQKQKKAKLDKIEKDKARRRKKIEKNKVEKKAAHEKILQEEKESQKKYEEIKKKKFLHEKIEEKYQSEVVIPALEEKKKKLKEIRQFSKNFNVNQILQFERDYTERRNQSLSMVKSKINEDWRYRPPQKTEKLSRFLEEEKIEQRKKLQEKKRKIDQKINRQQNFINYLREKFVPRIDEKKQKEIELRIQRDKNKRRQSETDSKVLGISYLEEAKRLAARKTIDTINRPQTQKHFTQKSDKKKDYTNYLISINHDQEYYQAKRRKRLERLINSQEPETEKIKQLKRETDKINEQLSRRNQLKKLKNKSRQMLKDEEDEDVELLLSGIQAKIGIINVFKQHNQ